MLTWAQFTAIPNGKRIVNHGYDQCVALANHYHTQVIGKPLPSGLGSAYQWWTTRNSQPNIKNNYNFSSRPVAGAIFVSRGGIYNVPDGHIGIVTSVNSNGTFNTMEQNAETWRYVGRYTRTNSKSQGILGFLVPKNNPAEAKLKKNQRRIGNKPVNQRKSPNTGGKINGTSLQPGRVLSIQGWVKGEAVSGNNIWYKLSNGNWAWSGGFTSKSTSGLTDLNPKAPSKPSAPKIPGLYVMHNGKNPPFYEFDVLNWTKRKISSEEWNKIAADKSKVIHKIRIPRAALATIKTIQ